MMNEPTIAFGAWKPWHSRDTTTSGDPFDPPPDFDVSGIYLWAHFKNQRQRKADKNGQLHLNPNVVYIGHSKTITRRLEGRRHEKVKEYEELFGDYELRHLYFSLCYAEWTSWDFQELPLSRARRAGLLYIERKLIWDFAKTYSKVPVLNKE
jgi:hypothetical protein